MKLVIFPAEKLEGKVWIPASKSHTIRAVIIASLAEGKSKILKPLTSKDAESAVFACRAMGADIDTSNQDIWTVKGVGGKPFIPKNVIDIGNSGTSLRLCLGAASLCDGWITFDGDEMTRKRPNLPLLKALGNLGVTPCQSMHQVIVV